MKKRVLYHFAAVITTTVIFASTFYYVICLGLRHSKQDAIGKYSYITSDTTYYNTVFFGASTVHLGINPQLFDSITGSNSFNASMDGIGIAEINLLIKKYIACHGAPQHIFIAFNEPTLGMERGVWYFSQYYPFVNDTDLNELVRLEPKLLLAKYAPAMAVTYFDDPLKNLGLIGLLKDYHKHDYTIPLKGFEKTFVSMQSDVPKAKAYFVGSKRGWQLLGKTLDLCADKNIQINFIMLPIYNHMMSDTSVKFVAKLQSFETKYHSQVINYTGNEQFNDKRLFADPMHLNAWGAEIFTTLLAKEFLKQQELLLTDSSNSAK